MRTFLKTYSVKTLTFLTTYKKISAAVGILIIAGGAYYVFKTPATTGTTVIQQVKVTQKSISVSVSGTGAISPTNTVDLKAKGSGDLRVISVKAGDTVKQGTRLMSLDATTAYQDVATAKVNLETAQLDLDKIKQPPETADVLQIQNQIDGANQTIKDQDTLVANAYTSLLNVPFEAVADVQSSSITPPTISGSYLGTTQGQIKVVSYLSGDGLRFTTSGLVTSTGLASLNTAQPLGDSGLYIKFASTDPQPNWIINIPNAKSSSYLSAYTAYQNALTNKQKNIDAQNRSIALLTEQLKKLKEGADSLDIRAKELVVAQRQNDLTEANNRLADYMVVAPFDGVIASVLAEVGDSVSQSTTLGTIITNKKIAEISLNEIDIAKVEVGQKVTLTFDAVSDLTVHGTIAEIDTLGTTSQGVVTYKVKIAFDDTDTRIKPGMTVTADILLDQKDDAVVVPNEAIKTVRGKFYVEIPDTSSTNAQATKQVEVTKGIVNDTQTEITSGLQAGDTVIIRRKVSTTTSGSTTGTTRSATSIIGGGGGGTFRTTGGGGARGGF